MKDISPQRHRDGKNVTEEKIRKKTVAGKLNASGLRFGIVVSRFNEFITDRLLRGDTAHYDVIVNEVTRGIGQSAQETGVPHAFGVLTCDTLEQAIDRAGLKMGNKGSEAALAALEMASLKKAITRKKARSSQQSAALTNKAVSNQPSAISQSMARKASSRQASAFSKSTRQNRSAGSK